MNINTKNLKEQIITALEKELDKQTLFARYFCAEPTTEGKMFFKHSTDKIDVLYDEIKRLKEIK